MVFLKLVTAGVLFKSTKSYIIYLFVNLLDWNFTFFTLLIIEENIAKDSKLFFIIILSILEKYLGIAGYFRDYILFYTQIT